MKKVLGCIKKADFDFNLIESGDRIAVGVSGGKDSMLLLYALHLYKMSTNKDFDVVGINIKLGFPNMDFTHAISFLETKGITFHQVDSQVYEILKIQANDDGTLKCSLCSKFKKAAVIKAAHTYNCNKVAFAHHADDAVETLVMNAIFGGRLSTFKPTMYLDREDITFIRPFVYLHESDITQAVSNIALPIVPSTCPMDGHTKRQETKEMLNDLYEKYPMSKHNFLRMLSNQAQLDLWETVK
jgi:tRNA(Ile)-lysidine synthase TilS/MesJ